MLDSSDEDAGAALRAELIALHNAGTIDALEPARNIADAAIGQSDFFFIQQVFVDIIPQLESTVPAMLAAVKALVARACNDLAAGMPSNAFRTWAERGPRALETLAAIDPDDAEDATYVFLALQALAKFDAIDALDRAIVYLATASSSARAAATKAIGTVELADTDSRRRAMDALAAALLDVPDDNLRGHLISAAVEIAIKAPELETRAVNLIDTAAAGAGNIAIHHTSSTLTFHAKELPPPIITALAAIAHQVHVDNKGTLDHLDHACWVLIQANRIDEALALITPILAAHAELTSLDRFDGFSHAALGLEPAQLAPIIVGWLLSLDHNLGDAARRLVSKHHGGNPLVLDFDASALGLSTADTILLAHRVIGYLFIHPVTTASLVLSLIRSAEPNARDAMTKVLFDPLLINFSGALADWLSTRAADATDPTKPVIDAILLRLEEYIGGLRRVGLIKELRPSERERLIENHRQHESMHRAYAAAEQKSVFLSIVSRSVMLYGNRSISYFEGHDGTSQRSEMKLHSFSHRIEAPRLDILEPFDLDYTLRVFRSMRATR